MASNVEIIVTATDKASGALKGIGGSLSALGVLGGVAKIAFAALAAAISGAGVAMAYFVSQAAEAELVQAKFNAIVGSSALAGFQPQMEAIATSMAKLTRFEDENILAAEAQLSLYQNIGQDIFPRVIATSLDLAEALGTDAVGGAEMLGRAMADIGEGSLNMLFRQKLITKEQQEMAEKMAKTGDEAGAQAYILGILEGKIGSLAETMGATFTGKMTILKNAFGDLSEELGGVLLPVLIPIIDKFRVLIDRYGPVLVKLFQDKIAPAVKKAVDKFMLFIDILTGDHAFNVEEWLKDLDWEAISEKIISAIDSVDWNLIGTTLGHWIGVAFEVAKNAVAGTDWSGLFTSLLNAFMDFSTGLGGGNTEKFIRTWADNIMALGKIIENIVRIIRERVGLFILAGKALVDGIGIGITLAFASLRARVESRIIILTALFTSRAGKWIAIGRAILDGIKAGINAGWSAFKTWLTEKIQAIVDAVLGALGIESPSKVFMNIGKQMMAGLAKGIGDGISIPVTAITGAVPQFAAATISGGTAGFGKGVNNHYYYGAKILLQQGKEREILSTLTE